MKQTEKILEYLKKFGSITSYQAYEDLDITQLGARLDDLQKEGYTFNKEIKYRKNRLGELKHYKEYSLKGE